jgi:hypothetical protein
MINLSPEREAELLADYKARVKAKEEANAMLDKMRADQRKKQDDFWKKINKPVPVKKTEKDYKCAGCNCLIPKGASAFAKPENVNVSGWGWQGQTLTRHYCLICSGALTDKKVEL